MYGLLHRDLIGCSAAGIETLSPELHVEDDDDCVLEENRYSR